jgi:hypothetical protein
MLTLGEITRHDDDLALERAVQLDWFTTDARRNEKLTRSFIWTKESPKGFVASTQVLNQTMEAFLTQNPLNELVIRATYGQGKTHLALALANYFGKPATSPEVKNMLEKYAHCTGQSAERFASFKAGRQPFLVLRLRGDRRENLAQAVVAGLEEALHQYPATATATLGLWFDEARRILGTFKEAEKEDANAFLALHALDLDLLDQKLAASDDTHYDLLHDLLRHVRHVTPNFGRTADPGQAIELVCDTYCGPGKPFAGLLVLFDEFSLFVNSYASTYRNQQGAPLQRFLDGIYNRKGKAVLLAFAQQSPHAHTLLKDKIQAGGGNLDDLGALIREMTRLDPKDEMSLYAPMEDVLDAYLNQDDDQWEKLMEDDELYSQATDAADEVQRLFPERYATKLGWDEERIQRVLVKGCFPLHPVATAIMCSVKLPATDNARSVLSFVVEAVQATAQEYAVRPDGKLNFIPATRLVQGLGEVLAEEAVRWRQYSDAAHQLGGEASAAWREVLQALFLHEVLELKVRPGEFAQNIAALSGLPVESCADILKTLHSRRYIRYDEGRDAYTFWPSGQSGTQVYEQLEKEVNAIFSNPAKLREELTAALNQEPYYWEMPLRNSYDWRASINLVPVSNWSLETLRDIVEVSKWDTISSSLQYPFRGFAIFPLAADEYEVRSIKANAEHVLNELVQEMGDNLPPLAIMLPTQPQTDLLRKLIGQRVLQSWKKDKQEQLGQQSYTEARASFDTEVDNLLEIASAQPVARTIVPRPYRASVEASGRTNTPEGALLACYQIAYRYVPPFFQQYKDNSRNLVKAVRMGCGYLAKGSFDGWEMAAQAFPVAQELFNRYLSVGGDTNWGYVDGSKRVSEPQQNAVRAAYQLLEEAVPRASEKVRLRPLLEQLLNPPYGLDINTLSLVYCGWYGSHHLHLEIKADDGQVLRLSDWLADGADPSKVINTLCRRDVTLTRRDETKLQGRVHELVKQIKAKKPLTLAEAESIVAELTQYETDPTLDERTKTSATEALKLLSADINTAATFEESVRKTAELLAAAPASGMTGLRQALINKQNLPNVKQLGSVRPATEAELSVLADQAKTRLGDVAQRLADDLARLASISHFELQKSKLDSLRLELYKANEHDLVDIVEQAKRKLELVKIELEAKSVDAPFLTQFDNLKAIQSLAQLRELNAIAAAHPAAHADTIAKLTKHRETLQIAISKAEQDLVNWQTKLAAIVKSKDLIDFKTVLDTNRFRYEGTPEEATLDALITQRETVKKLFKKLADLSEQAPSTHTELQKLLTAYDKLAAQSDLSAPQQALATTARAAASARLQQQIAQAITGFQSLVARSQEPEYDEISLMGELNRESPFLPKDHQIQLAALRKTVRAKIDDNVAKRVEDLVFNEISDPAKQRECLLRLQARFEQDKASGTSAAPVAEPAAVYTIADPV